MLQYNRKFEKLNNSKSRVNICRPKMHTIGVVALACYLAAGASAASTRTAKDTTVFESKIDTKSAVMPVAEPVVAESKKVMGSAGAMDGYVKTKSDKGDRGYDENGSYGLGDSDSYGFGSQIEYGGVSAGDGDHSGAYHESSSFDDNGKFSPKYKAWHFEQKDGKPTKRYVFDSRKPQTFSKKKEPLVEATEYDSVEAYDGDDGSAADFEADEPEYGSLYDSADVYNDADTYY